MQELRILAASAIISNLLAGGCVPVTRNPGVFVWVTNSTSEDVRITYFESRGDRTFLVPAGAVNRPTRGSFPAPEPYNSVVVYDTGCHELARADVPESGSFLVTISSGLVTVEQIPSDEHDYSQPALEVATSCS